MTTYEATYDMALDNVKRPADAQDRWGEQEMIETDSSYVFEDGFVKATWIPLGSIFFVRMENKTDNSIRIDWNQSAFVGPDGSSETLVHGEMKRYQIGQEVAPTVIPADGRVESLVGPEGGFGDNGPLPRRRQVQGGGSDGSDPGANFRQEVSDLEGKTVQVLMPLQIEDELNEYTFTFRVNGVSVSEQ